MSICAFRIILILLFFSFSFFTESYSYQALDGKYNYNQFHESNEYNVPIKEGEEEVLFIVDFSNSMNKKMGYISKAYHAIDSIRRILNNSGDRTKIGLRIFGVTDKPIIQRDRDGYSWHKENLCTASTLVMPIARYNAENISDKLGQLNPQGVSPIGYSLRQAVQNDFSPSAKLKHIILVTDGAENCGDDPCLFIKRLVKLRDDIKIDVIGITVDENAYSQLNCLSVQTKGNYYTVNTPEDFKIKFEQAFYSSPQKISKTQKIITQTYSPSQQGIKYKNFVIEFDD